MAARQPAARTCTSQVACSAVSSLAPTATPQLHLPGGISQVGPAAAATACCAGRSSAGSPGPQWQAECVLTWDRGARSHDACVDGAPAD
mmetsp:Transcript_1850/g.4795  ORF Transcript_1850/g.4795 Transcript_1850/m.4795 type:complete len:89 (+) Transcript_1850:329-595(+)